ncbi:hypothetical protein SAG0176_01900 [Streptococcus agalactiae LDS 623]|uniref:hypothetical protein n=1 Tax=Streptococcus agalactiae TaxID=1311 RepID=UPI0002BAB36C|nr:hypothetical protein [Streptococcus agalactiae]EPU42999.1 hypothetical protein SAG0181_05475 [Streptococcus agalactiae LDS 628]EPX12318.1 hypothetical protein SAG0176_01900 [Streptococcus agalactiae LDS 623]
MKKYELLKDDTIEVAGKTLFRIRALKDFGSVEKGDIGGYVESEENLSNFGNAWVEDNARISGNVRISENAWISGNVWITGDACISSDRDYIIFKNNWSSGRYFVYTRSNKMWSVGCFCGTGDELIKKAYADSEESGRKYELYVNLVKELYRDE